MGQFLAQGGFSTGKTTSDLRHQHRLVATVVAFSKMLEITTERMNVREAEEGAAALERMCGAP